jgi:hypothetical protein
MKGFCHLLTVMTMLTVFFPHVLEGHHRVLKNLTKHWDRPAMTVHELLHLLEAGGIAIRVHEAGLRCSPKHLVTPELRELISQHKAGIIAVLSEQEREGMSYWRTLLESGKSDLDVSNLDEAIFLFAAAKLRNAEALSTNWDRFSPYWEKRLPVHAWKLLQELQGFLQPQSPGGERTPQQIVMNKDPGS